VITLHFLPYLKFIHITIVPSLWVPSLLTACQMALAVTSGLSRTFAVSGLVTHYINAHDHRNLRKVAPMLRVGATRTNNNNNNSLWVEQEKKSWFDSQKGQELIPLSTVLRQNPPPTKHSIQGYRVGSPQR
jgi:hypothetical protein